MDITIILLASLCLILALVILVGKGDWMIAGYNTASPKERKKYNIKRLRIVMFVLLVVTALFVLSILYTPPYLIGLTAQVLVIICIIGVILANTWAKK